MTESDPLASLCDRLAKQARQAARQLALAGTEAKNGWLRAGADDLSARREELLTANRIDLAAAPGHGLDAAATDRLTLTPARIDAMAEGLRQVAALPDPVGEIRDERTRPNGLLVRQVGVPLGVIFFVYESRPNVTADAAALCVKSGNAVILRGGKEAANTNRAIADLLGSRLGEFGLPEHAIQLVPTTDRDAVGRLLRMSDLIDLTIPRGGESLIRRVAAEATMPVLKHDRGVCHVYVDRDADPAMAEQIVINGKCHRPGVCNATECLLIHRDIAEAFLTRLGPALRDRGVELRGCERTRIVLPWATPATPDDFGREFLALILAIRVVDSIDDAIAHIEAHGSHHTDAIVTGDPTAARQFLSRVDSSAVLVNASTRFNDGFEIGLGAEIGISTSRFHARGPCGLRELTTTKYLISGNGQIRS